MANTKDIRQPTSKHVVLGSEGIEHLGFEHPASARRVYFVILGGAARGTTLRCPLNPQTLDMERRATYVDHGIPGQSEERSHYIHGSQLTLRFTLRLEAKSEIMYLDKVGVVYRRRDGHKTEPLSRSKTMVDGGEKLLQCYNFLDSLCFAREVDSLTSIGAPPFLLVWGSKLRFTCTMRSVSARWEEFQPGSNTPIRGDVSIEAKAFIRGGMTQEERLIHTNRGLLDSSAAKLPTTEKAIIRDIGIYTHSLLRNPYSFLPGAYEEYRARGGLWGPGGR